MDGFASVSYVDSRLADSIGITNRLPMPLTAPNILTTACLFYWPKAELPVLHVLIAKSLE